MGARAFSLTTLEIASQSISERVTEAMEAKDLALIRRLVAAQDEIDRAIDRKPKATKIGRPLGAKNKRTQPPVLNDENDFEATGV